MVRPLVNGSDFCNYPRIQCEFEFEERGGASLIKYYGLIRELGLEQEIWKEKQEEKQEEKQKEKESMKH